MTEAAAQPPANEQGLAPVIPFNSAQETSPEQELRDLRARNRMLEQLCLALGDENRYFASERYGHYANDNEAFIHFIEKGGKKAFDQTHPVAG